MENVYQRALELLTRREHSRQELQHKLIARGFLQQDVSDALNELVTQGWQNDGRFTEIYTRHRAQAGFGPQRILAELKQRGIKIALEDLLQSEEFEWQQVLEQAWKKRFQGQVATDQKSYAKQVRFLLNRGFDLAQIRQWLDSEVDRAKSNIR